MRIEPSARDSLARLDGGGLLPSSRPGFAELIEEGYSAKAIVAHRALRFLDVGVLGLHNPVGDVVGDSASAWEVEHVRSDPVGLVEQPEWNQAGRLPQGKNAPDLVQLPMQANDEVSALSASGFDGERAPSQREEAGFGTRFDIGTSSTPPSLALPMGYSDRVGPQVPMEAESSSSTPREPALVRIAYLPSGTAVRIQLVPTAEGVVAIAEGFALEPQESASIDNVAKAVAADFGVTIRRVVIGRNTR